MLYYGVLSSRVNLDMVAEASLAALRRVLGVDRLHAAELGNHRLGTVAPRLAQVQKQFGLRFDIYRVAKLDHAIICFFDQIFDQGMNPAVTWTGYWTPLRYVLLLKIASLFDEDLAKKAWSARINPDNAVAHANVQAVCRALCTRLHALPDARSRQLLGDALMWAEQHIEEMSYNVSSKTEILQITPNVVGFQTVMHGIASGIQASGRQASRIVVDQQSQFNKAQRTLAEFYQSARDIKPVTGPGMPEMDFKHMPRVPIEFASSARSAGLELVDIHLWIFKRAMERNELAPPLYALIRPHLHRGRTDEISLNAIANRWTKYFDRIPQLDEMSKEQLERGLEILRVDEERRIKAVRAGIAAMAVSRSQ